MNSRMGSFWIGLLLVFLLLPGQRAQSDVGRSLTLAWQNETLSIRGPHLPGGELTVWYMEASCRPGSTRLDWTETVIPHRTRLVEAGADHRLIRLRSELNDGVVVDHEIRAGDDEVDFRVMTTNPGPSESLAHWAQSYVWVDRFTGTRSEPGSEAHLPRCFIFVDSKLKVSVLRTPFCPCVFCVTVDRDTPGIPQVLNVNDVEVAGRAG